MSFPYVLLHFEAQEAKEELAQVFRAGRGLRSVSLSPTLTKSGPVMNKQKGRARRPEPSQTLRRSRDVSRDPTRKTTSQEQSGRNTRDMSAFSFTLTLLLLGTIAAARTDHPACWLLFGPTPFAVGYAALTFFRQGFGRRVFRLTFGQQEGQNKGRSCTSSLDFSQLNK
jgi:hypothetical protein